MIPEAPQFDSSGRQNPLCPKLYTKPALSRRPTLNDERPRSSRRLRSSCAAALSLKPGTTLSASSMDFDQTKLARNDNLPEKRFSALSCSELYDEFAMFLR